jgi:subtilase family serine protease
MINKLISIILWCSNYLTMSNGKVIYIALKQKNIEVLKERLIHISDPYSDNYGTFMDQQEIMNIIAPPIDSQNRVINWLSGYPVNNIKNYYDSITFETNEDNLYELLDIKSSNKKMYSIPIDLRDTIDFIEYDSTYNIKQRKINIHSKNSDVDNRYFGRESYLNIYSIDEFNINGSISGGLIEYQSNGGFANSDLTLQQTNNNQNIKLVSNIVGPNDGSDPESELDVQLLSQSADGVNIWFWDTPNWLYGFSVDFFNSRDRPDVISMSWGWAEDSQCDITTCGTISSQQYVERVNNEYLKINLLGTTITVSSGDAGAPGRTSEGCDKTRPINPVFPGSSPYVLSVGATYVENDNSSLTFNSSLCQNNSCVEGTNETSIFYNKTGWTAGGGFSIYDSRPKWQESVVKDYLMSNISLPNYKHFNNNGRAYPDVSAVGHSCPTYIGGILNGVDGTSCSSPIVAGLITIINNHQWSKNRSIVGFVNPLLYDIFKNCDDCFQDITRGVNWCTEQLCCDNHREFGFQATKGYDPVSGLGTFNIRKILNHLETHEYSFN